MLVLAVALVPVLRIVELRAAADEVEVNADDSRYMVEVIRSWIPMVVNGNLEVFLFLLLLMFLLLLLLLLPVLPVLPVLLRVDLLDVVCISAGFDFNFSWDRTGELVLTTTSEFMHKADLTAAFIC